MENGLLKEKHAIGLLLLQISCVAGIFCRGNWTEVKTKNYGGGGEERRQWERPPAINPLRFMKGPFLAWVSGVSGGKGERWKRKRERAEGEKRLTQMLLLEPSTSTQHDSKPSNQNHIRSLGCQLHVSKRSPKINLTIRSCWAPVLVLLRFCFFWNLQWRVFEYL